MKTVNDILKEELDEYEKKNFYEDDAEDSCTYEESTDAEQSLDKKKMLLDPEVFVSEVQEDSKQNRKQKENLLSEVVIMLKKQIFVLNVIIVLAVLSLVLDFKFIRSMDTECARVILGFLKYYIAAVVVELLGILVYITKSVYGKNIFDDIKKLSS